MRAARSRPLALPLCALVTFGLSSAYAAEGVAAGQDGTWPAPVADPPPPTPPVHPSWQTPPPAPSSATPLAAPPPGPSVAPMVGVPESSPAAPPPASPSRPGRGLTIAGFVVFGAAYATTGLAGALMIDRASDDDNGLTSYERAAREAVGRRMLIPVIGPFLAIDPAQSAGGSFGLALAGLAQAAGLVMGTVGAVRLARHRRRVHAHYQPLPGGGSVHVRLRF